MNTWYFSKDGKQEGPVSAVQIVALVNASAIDPATTQVWREGLADWIPLAQSTVFTEAGNLSAPAIAPVRSPAAVNPYAVSPSTLAASRANRPDMPLEYPGLGRLAYFLTTIGICIVFYIILFFVIFTAFSTNSMAGMMGAITIFSLLTIAGTMFLGSKRTINLGMSGWAVLWSLVPFMNVWIAWRMMACPAGYEDHRTLDTAGKVISGIWIGIFALAFLAPLIGGLAGGR